MISIGLGILLFVIATMAFACAVKGAAKRMPQKGEG